MTMIERPQIVHKNIMIVLHYCGDREEFCIGKYFSRDVYNGKLQY